MDKVRYGVIGIGNMGSGHVDWLSKARSKTRCLPRSADIRPSGFDWFRANIKGESPASTIEKLLSSGLWTWS